ncbi:ribonuclease HII [Bergeyella cardium]|uniref:Ribonuclease HII n=1 Tax=Bergeyella cardium TaxID=1585976 RepID=A0A6P1QT54_9FLAO|nr:ribonuclease HII [Bergeyella cardium]QHN64989.1 ribonuclease HII [Bergeyella cardium]WHE34302.1 ribonuclease HII [Bergeyella cardium]WHF60953.1 ribonuclease HII [Bergeyella cardium]
MALLTRLSEAYIEAGCDEVGRGCLCGPVVAAAVILKEGFQSDIINDSKKLSAKQRAELDLFIRENALDYAITELPAEYIDKHNILNASIEAMHRSLDKLHTRPELILVDGNRFHPYHFIPHRCIVKGDSKLMSIACASILAKNYRDNLMIQLHEEFPQYGWNKNMGYPTKTHREALKKYGATPYHRKSFRLDYNDE